jgi:2-hydroxy-3-oxopropionate reductase
MIVLVLPDTPDVEGVLFGPEGVAQGLKPSKTVIDMSSISPIATREFAGKIEALGCDYLDAPVSGGEVGARNAALSIMVGGKPEAFARAKPLFDLMGKAVTHVGGIGAGQIAKVANQIIVALTIGAVAEGLLFASKAGADPAKVREAITGGLATSRILELHGERMIKRTFDPGFRIALHQKDLNLALEGARTLGLSLPGTALVQQLFSTCVANGAGGSDHSALVRALEIMANHQVSPPNV